MSTPAGAPDARDQLASLIFAVLLLDEDDKIVEANHAAEEMLGRSARKLSEKRFWDVVGISDQRLSDRLQSNDAQIVARGATIATAIGDRRVVVCSHQWDFFFHYLIAPCIPPCRSRASGMSCGSVLVRFVYFYHRSP